MSVLERLGGAPYRQLYDTLIAHLRQSVRGIRARIGGGRARAESRWLRNEHEGEERSKGPIRRCAPIREEPS